ncbi:MAG: helix-turn-helix transcriptional regulator [Pseudomonadota bacterium]
MSSPFSVFLKNIRLRNSQRQSEMAEILGYEQAYISSVELGTKPPSQEFLNRLSTTYLNDRDQSEMMQEIQESKRRFVLPVEVPTETYRLCSDLWGKIDRLHPAQIKAIRELLKLDELMANTRIVSNERIRRRAREESKM